MFLRGPVLPPVSHRQDSALPCIPAALPTRSCSRFARFAAVRPCSPQPALLPSTIRSLLPALPLPALPHPARPCSSSPEIEAGLQQPAHFGLEQEVVQRVEEDVTRGGGRHA